MTARIFALVVIVWLWFGAVLPVGAANLTHTPPKWQTIGRGLTFTQVQVLQDGEVVAGLAVVKIDPASNAFRVFHGAPQAISVWQRQIQAPIVFNGSYYKGDGQPLRARHCGWQTPRPGAQPADAGNVRGGTQGHVPGPAPGHYPGFAHHPH